MSRSFTKLPKIVLSVFGLILIAAATWFILNPPNVLKLSDGSRLTLVGAAPGGGVVHFEPSLVRMARRWAPTGLQRRFPPAGSLASIGSTNDLALVFRVDAQTNSTRIWSSLVVEDDQGFRFTPLGPGSKFVIRDTEYRRFNAINFPRRQTRFKVLVLGTNGSVLGSFRVANPNSTVFPEWTPQRMPISSTHSGVTLTLHSLKASSGPIPFVEPGWTVLDRERFWTNSKIRLLEIVDATGNRIRGTTLAPTETAWKVHAVVESETNSLAAPHWIELTGVAIPKVGASVVVPVVSNAVLPGITALKLTRDESAPTASGMPRNLAPEVARQFAEFERLNRQRLTIEWIGARPSDSLTFHLEATDDKDRRKIYRLESPKPIQLDAFPHPDATTFHLRIGISREVPFEFIITPSEVQPATL